MSEPKFLIDADQPSVTRSLRSLAQSLLEIGYTAPALAQLLGATTIYEPDLLAFPFFGRRAANGSHLGAAARLFLLEDALSPAEAATFLGTDLVDALIEVDLLTTLADDSLRSVVNLFPVGELLLATDPVFFRESLPFDCGAGREVYYVGRDSFDLAEALPRDKFEHALDLCTGSGVQALCASARTKAVIGVDVNARAVRFARVNALMNGIDNATFVDGDLFSPVVGRRFDLVIANPPFVAAPMGERSFYRDGGPLGDHVLRNLMAGLSDYLAPNGEAYIITQFVRRPNEEQVLATTLGGLGFDVLILDLAHYDVRTFVAYHAHGSLLHGGWVEYAAEVDRWLDHASVHGIETLSYSIVAIRRASSFHLSRRTVPAAASAANTSPAQVIERWRAQEPTR
jgi:carbamoyltransferase